MDDLIPFSVMLKRGTKMLCMGFISNDDPEEIPILYASGALEYSMHINENGHTGVSVRAFDPATDDDLISISMEDVLCVNIMNDHFLDMFRKYHFDANQFDTAFLTDAARFVKGNFPQVQ